MGDLYLIAGVALGSLLIVISGAGLLLGSLYLLFRNTSKRHPVRPIYLIFSFLLLALCFPKGITSLFGIITSIFSETADLLAGAATAEADGATDQSAAAASSGTLVKNIFDSQLWYNAILFFAGFLFIGFIAERAVDYFTRSQAAQADDQAGFRVLVKNTVIALVILLALFFSITSIIAVPIIGNRTAGTSTLENQLKDELETYSRDDQAIRQEYLDLIREKSEAVAGITISTASTDTVKTDAQSSTDVNIHTVIDSFSNFRKRVDATFRKMELMRHQAVARMQITDHSNLTPALRLKDKSELVGWYVDNRSSYLAELEELGNDLDYNVSDLLVDRVFYAFDFISDDPIPEPTSIPEKPVLGSDLGVFTYFTGWLLSIESYSLIIIIGLIGFGLLGAGGATFIREQDRDNKRVFIDDIAGVLVKGFTAAVVVFLGVQGGLAVLTTEGAQLNAYALFFVCFVAAVFSDDAWDWARKRFGDRINSEEPVVVVKEVPPGEAAPEEAGPESETAVDEWPGREGEEGVPDLPGAPDEPGDGKNTKEDDAGPANDGPAKTT